MNPTTDGGQNASHKLEDRLRGLILNSGTQNSESRDGLPAGAVESLPAEVQRLPSSTPQDHIRNKKPQASPANASTGSPSNKKRLNQAQRRQQNAQLTIAIDPRQTEASYGNHAGRGRGQATRHYHSPRNLPTRGSASIGSSSPFDGQLMSQQHLSQHQPSQSPNMWHQNHGRLSAQMHHNTFQRQDRGLSNMHNPASTYAGSPFMSRWTHDMPRSEYGSQFGDRPLQHQQLYNPGPPSGYGRGRLFDITSEELAAQVAMLEELLTQVSPLIGIDEPEIKQKEKFRAFVEQACRHTIANHERITNPRFDPMSVQLKCFGSMASGFATKASDMDLALLSPFSEPHPHSTESPIPRLLEKVLLENDFGARLLTRTRVPIIKLCEQPTEKLRKDLLEARSKWEAGVTAEVGEEDAVAETKLDDERSADVVEDARSPLTSELGTRDTEQSSSENPLGQLQSLRQKPMQSIHDYFLNAKKLLKKLVGRDLNVGYSSVTKEERVISDDLCKAFILGLSDEALQSRLRTYNSLSFEPVENPAYARSLNGILIQVEGERLVMAWESRPLNEATERQDIETERLIEEWRALQNAQHLNTMSLNKQLHVALDRLKRVPSLQLVFLEQGQFEDPTNYYENSCRIMRDLGGQDRPSADNSILHIVIAYYIAGINDSKVRKTLEEQNSKGNISWLKDAYKRHRLAQMAYSYEKALAAGIYQKGDQQAIQNYVDLLLRSAVDTSISLRRSSLPPATLALLDQIRALPDPTQQQQQQLQQSGRARDRYRDHLEFPRAGGVGIQCDINFSAQLALHNTHLLRCYAACDARVRPLVLLVKQWARARAINTPYRGTLSSYGYVLMVLHYLVNVASPFVCPNLQLIRRPQPPPQTQTQAQAQAQVHKQATDDEASSGGVGEDVHFWRNEPEIRDLAARGLLSHNHEPAGALLRGFFEYFAHTGPLSTGGGGSVRGFDWGRDVLSLRTQGGLVSKASKGWTGARTTVETATSTSTSTPAPAPAPTSATATATVTTPGPETISPQPTADAAAKAPAAAAAAAAAAAVVVVVEETKEVRHRYLFAVEDPFEVEHNVARTVTHNGIVAIRDEFRRAWRLIRAAGKQGGQAGEGGGGRKGPRTEQLLDEAGETPAQKGTWEAFLEDVHA